MEKKYGEYRNLKAELTRSGVTQTQVAEYIGLSPKSLNLRINGFIPFTVHEIVSIQQRFTPDATLEYLTTVEG